MTNQASYYIRMFIALGYIIIGYIILTSDAGEVMTGNKIFSYVFGGACIAYGLFRAYRNQKKMEVLTHEKDNEARSRYLDDMK